MNQGGMGLYQEKTRAMALCMMLVTLIAEGAVLDMRLLPGIAKERGA